MLEADVAVGAARSREGEGTGNVAVTVSPLTFVLADAAENLYPARMQMAISLGWHIVFSCLGVAFPAIAVFAEWRAHRTGRGSVSYWGAAGRSPRRRMWAAGLK